MMKLGLDYQKDDTATSVSYERIQSTNNKAHSYGIEGAVRWKELPLFVVRCLTDVNTKGNCFVGGSLATGKYVIRFHLDTADVVTNERR
jgi:hypothetical protein